MTLKRGYCEVAFEMPDVSKRHHFGGDQQLFTGSAHQAPAPQAHPLASPEALNYLDGLSRCMSERQRSSSNNPGAFSGMGGESFHMELDCSTSAQGWQHQQHQHQHQHYPTSPAVPQEYWLCTAELNLLMAAHFQTLPGSALRSYHSFTRMPRSAVWAHFAASQGLDSAAAAATLEGRAAHGPMHVQMAGHLLGRVLRQYPEAALQRITFTGQHWLSGWAAKWGYTAPDLTVVAVSVYPAAASCSSSCGGSGDAPQGRPVRTVYVPQFSA